MSVMNLIAPQRAVAIGAPWRTADRRTVVWLSRRRAPAQAIEFANGTDTSATRQPEQVVAGTMAEWRSLWSRVGAHRLTCSSPAARARRHLSSARARRGLCGERPVASRRRDRIMRRVRGALPPDVMIARNVLRPRRAGAGRRRPVQRSSHFGGRPRASRARHAALAAAAPAGRRPADLALGDRADQPRRPAASPSSSACSVSAHV
jgi:hypothetical protein